VLTEAIVRAFLIAPARSPLPPSMNARNPDSNTPGVEIQQQVDAFLQANRVALGALIIQFEGTSPQLENVLLPPVEAALRLALTQEVVRLHGAVDDVDYMTAPVEEARQDLVNIAAGSLKETIQPHFRGQYVTLENPHAKQVWANV
jgi:hypothetical protein